MFSLTPSKKPLKGVEWTVFFFSCEMTGFWCCTPINWVVTALAGGETAAGVGSSLDSWTEFLRSAGYVTETQSSILTFNTIPLNRGTATIPPLCLFLHLAFSWKHTLSPFQQVVCYTTCKFPSYFFMLETIICLIVVSIISELTKKMIGIAVLPRDWF